MAAAARARAAPLHPGLPDEIFIWEILLRLPPKALLRCRAVCSAWRSATSARDFLLAHHGRQPSLPLLYEGSSTYDDGRCGHLDILPLDHRAGVAADQLRPVARLGISGAFTLIKASCDGLLVISFDKDEDFDDISVINPATRQYAPLPLHGFGVAGMYLHPPTGEYRLLLFNDAMDDDESDEDDAGDNCYVYTLGSCEPPRDIGWAEAEDAIHEDTPLLFRGGLHWFLDKEDGEGGKITVFDTTAESFRQMRVPDDVPCIVKLFATDAMLGMATDEYPSTTVDIWMAQDYDGEVWAKYRVELPGAQLTARFGYDEYSTVMVSSCEDDDAVLILVQTSEWLLLIDIGGELVASFSCESLCTLCTTDFRLKQSLVPHAFFPAIEGYVVNSWPFLPPDDHGVNN